MDQQAIGDERRLFRRYAMEEPVLITGDNLVGLVKDLSCGGCSFRYLKKRHETESLPGGEYALCLDPLDMATVRVQTVEEVPEYEAADSLAGTMYLRRVKFDDLNPLQLQSLLQFIRKNCMATYEESLALREAGLLHAKSAKANLSGVSPSPGC